MAELAAPMRRPSPTPCLVLLAGLLASCSPEPAPADVPAPPSLERLDELTDSFNAGVIRSATAAVNASPDDAQGWYRLGLAYEAASMNEPALEAYRAAAALDPEDPKAPYRAAICADRAQDPDTAMALMRTVVELAPDYASGWRRLGFLRLDVGDLEGATAAFATVEELLPHNADAPIGFTRTALLADDLEAASRHALEALDRAPEAPYVRLLLGETLRRQGKAAEAAAHLAAGEGSVPSFIDPWSVEITRLRNRDQELVEEAQDLEQRRRFAEALELYEQVLERRPADPFPLLRRAVLLMTMERHAEALAAYDEGVQRLPGNQELATGRVSALRALGRTEEARAAAEDAVERWPEEPMPYLVRGQLDADAGDVPRARASFQRFTALAPGDLRGRILEARILRSTSRPEEAAYVLTKGLDLDELSPPLTYFALLMASQSEAGASQNTLRQTYERAVAVHGEKARSLVK